MYRHSIAAVVRAVGVGKWGASVTVVMALIPLCANASPVKFECSYTQYSDASGAHPASEPFKITYVMDGMKGNILGNNIAQEVQVISGTGQVSFVEATGMEVVVTTITQAMDSVNSRNVVIDGKLHASQYYGRCNSTPPSARLP